MTTEYRNNAFSTITAGLTTSASDVTVSVVSDATFPSVTSPNYFYATLEDTAGQVEILKVTASKVVANQFTVIRGVDNTVPLVWAIGSIIEMRIVRAMIEEFRDHNHTATYADLTKTISNSYQFAFRTSSATDAYTASMVVAPPVYVVGLRVQFLADRANTGACTLNLNSLGVKDIKTQAGANPPDGYIAVSSFVDLEYNGVDFRLMSPAAAANQTLTLPIIDDTEGDSVLTFGETASAVNSLVITNNSTGIPPIVSSTGEANTGLILSDSNGNELIYGVSQVDAVNYLQMANTPISSPPTISAAGADTHIDLNFTAKGTGNVLVDSVPIYGMVILDDPEELVSNTSTSSFDWATFNMSGGGTNAAAAATAGATSAILKIYARGVFTIAGAQTGYIAKSGQTGSASADVVNRASIVDGDGTWAVQAISEVTTNLDANSDFQYAAVRSNMAVAALTIYLVGYYV